MRKKKSNTGTGQLHRAEPIGQKLAALRQLRFVLSHDGAYQLHGFRVFVGIPNVESLSG